MLKGDLLAILAWVGFLSHDLFHTILQDGALIFSISASIFAIRAHILNRKKKRENKYKN